MGFMKYTLALCLLAGPLAAQETATGTDEFDAVEIWESDRTIAFEGPLVDLSDFQWIARPLVVFADTPADPRFQRQMELLAVRPEDLAERDVVVIVDTDPEAFSSIRQELRPRGYMMAIVGKDGAVLIRKPLPWDLREITRNIDKLPLRQQEIIDRRRLELVVGEEGDS